MMTMMTKEKMAIEEICKIGQLRKAKKSTEKACGDIRGKQALRICVYNK